LAAFKRSFSALKLESGLKVEGLRLGNWARAVLAKSTRMQASHAETGAQTSRPRQFRFHRNPLMS
jgi:hypothetical protein